MRFSAFGDTGRQISSISFGASSLGGVFHTVDEAEAIATVHAALEAGINYFDVAPAYGGTRSEIVLGKALKGINRSRYLLSTKVGKYTDPAGYGTDTLDYSRLRIRDSIDESSARLGTDYFDIIHIHDIEYQQRQHTAVALTEGYAAVQELKREGRVGAVSFGIYPMDLWWHIFESLSVDAGLIHNHYCLNDTRLLELLPIAQKRNIFVINASPFASGLLTDRGPADWHPATTEERAVFQKAAKFCAAQGVPISQLALQFSCQHSEIPTTMFSTANRKSLMQVLEWHDQKFDPALVAEVRSMLASVSDRDWY